MVLAKAEEANEMVWLQSPGKAVYPGPWERVSWLFLHLFQSTLVSSNDIQLRACLTYKTRALYIPILQQPQTHD